MISKYHCYYVLFWLFRAPKTKGWCILGSCFWITSPWKTCSERLALFFASFISLLSTLWHTRVTTTCLGTCSRTSTICSIWCVPHGPLPTPPNPPAASVTSLRRRRRVPRWVFRLLCSSFHHWLHSFHHPRPCLNTHMYTCLNFVVWKLLWIALKTLILIFFCSRFKTLTVLLRGSTASRLQREAVMDSETEVELSLTTICIYSICKSKIL